ncbi:hypothetical protein L202_05852 [Cryptococcus amylolentus CBS 6039]|uniref:Uncharacterized protein n=1 Tax=Cryptococcus amylolentus CBS 6039 TaxID=1295533 RepID=A0A1E3HHN3_9TREE|nr:hypothetical protein L202_05852 [Cryptococcus amylolentus CBS 6039]ODN75860.1 hypothetical protein L202_05852 [Cryptococcus amylolentus CBS 6039]
MVSSKTSAVSRQSSEVPQPEHEKEAALSCTSSSTASDDTTDITLVFPAEISYRLDTEGPGARILSKADPSKEPSFAASPQQHTWFRRQTDGWLVKSGYHDWYIRNLSIQAGTIGDCDGIVSAINTQDQPIDFPTPLGDIRAGRFSGSWVTQAQEGTKATDATFFHSAERKYFEGVQEETGNEYELLRVEVGDYVNGDEGELVNYSTFRDAVQSDTKKNGNLSKWYDNARWTFRAQSRAPTEKDVSPRTKVE